MEKKVESKAKAKINEGNNVLSYKTVITYHSGKPIEDFVDRKDPTKGTKVLGDESDFPKQVDMYWKALKPKKKGDTYNIDVGPKETIESNIEPPNIFEAIDPEIVFKRVKKRVREVVKDNPKEAWRFVSRKLNLNRVFNKFSEIKARENELRKLIR